RLPLRSTRVGSEHRDAGTCRLILGGRAGTALDRDTTQGLGALSWVTLVSFRRRQCVDLR
ncbi:hypothetical protein, partial [Mycobacterium marinum]|uniref:hypothetical protein n=1 Tax=Mycobacterium marinum TaxID=1781 RepID=UPI0021C46866